MTRPRSCVLSRCVLMLNLGSSWRIVLWKCRLRCDWLLASAVKIWAKNWANAFALSCGVVMFWPLCLRLVWKCSVGLVKERSVFQNFLFFGPCWIMLVFSSSMFCFILAMSALIALFSSFISARILLVLWCFWICLRWRLDLISLSVSGGRRGCWWLAVLNLGVAASIAICVCLISAFVLASISCSVSMLANIVSLLISVLFPFCLWRPASLSYYS